MKISSVNKYDLVLHDVPLCAICNKPVERMESMYAPEWYAKKFRVYCHGDMEESMLSDELIEDGYSVRFGQAFIDKLPQPQLEKP
ncbi:hypothetical protein UFOVP133_67 [uncultured Caudovirales phage]|uniref:Uncharacterized protein n=1 Tax=uncultured Caudovirales phage TaxID=2100421 RepID=A0A6J5L9S2_9CAUD|nr:hypothetical protein UFOVP133_67 [uncultured Caudovirales phage]